MGSGGRGGDAKVYHSMWGGLGGFTDIF